MNPLDLRTQIPITSECAFFNTGASGPSPTPVLDAATGFITHHKTIAPYTNGMYPHADSAYESSRETIATHLGTAPENIALTESTTDSIGMVAGAIDWQPGDVIVRTDTEHPAGVLPWERAARVHGATVEVLETDAGVIDREQFTDAVADARVVCFSSLVWSYGNRVPVRELVEIAHDHDTFVIVDAVQSAGQMAVDLSEWGADVVAGSGHKWLLGPWGSGISMSTRIRSINSTHNRSAIVALLIRIHQHTNSNRMHCGLSAQLPHRHHTLGWQQASS